MDRERRRNRNSHDRASKRRSQSPEHSPNRTHKDKQKQKVYEENKKVQHPNYKTSGLLAKESNQVNGVALKYVEPTDACLPDKKPVYRLFVFKGDNIIDKIELAQRKWFLLGRDSICNIKLEGASCSKQHAVIQFRRITTTNKYNEKESKIKCYLIDLESSYGTKLNHDDIPSSRFIELRNKDMIQFGGIKDLEYVLIAS